ncbi:MAG: hypothetical protein K0S10_206, partial [Rubrobacteraceae bacterium]|nr:hypothetical protein [Rubrobacteraceae bacterium]
MDRQPGVEERGEQAELEEAIHIEKHNSIAP